MVEITNTTCSSMRLSWKTAWLIVSLLTMAAPPPILHAVSSQEAERSIGVKVGDWGNYDSSVLSYESNIPGYEDRPMWLEAIESIEWFIIEVVTVSGDGVTLQFGAYYKDGTRQFETRTGDPITGSGNLADALAPAGLGPGSRFYLWLEEWGYPEPITATVSGTSARLICGEVREVNHVVVSLSHPEGGNHSFEYYFDKETGACVDQLLSYSYVGVREGTELYMRYSWSVTMTATNLWGPASAVIPDPQSVTEAAPVIIDATETVNAIIGITGISDSCIIKIEKATGVPPAPSGLQPVGDSILIDASKMVTTSAVLRVSYSPAEVSDKGVVEGLLALHYWDGRTWVPVQSHVNVEERYVWAEIGHFSVWSLMGGADSSVEGGFPVFWVFVIAVCVAVVLVTYFTLARIGGKWNGNIR